MRLIVTFLAAVATLLTTQVAGQGVSDGFCIYAGIPPWECDVCDVGSSAGVPCCPNNATYDDLRPGTAVGQYKNANWDNFRVRAVNTSHIVPQTAPNVAAITAGKTGRLTFGPAGAPTGFSTDTLRIYSFYYACTAAASNLPIACDITFNGTCQLSSGANGTYSQFFQTIRYTPAYVAGSTIKATMQYHQGYVPTGPGYEDFGSIGCHAYDITAKSIKGKPVSAKFDNVTYGVLSNCNDLD